MKLSLTQILAIAIFIAGIATGANAQQGAPATAAPNMPAHTHPCASERQNVVNACKADPCTPACKQAHQQMKACRAANNLPEHPHASSSGAKKPGCKTTSATPSSPGNMPAPGNAAPSP